MSWATTSSEIPSSNQISEFMSPALAEFAEVASGIPAEIQKRGASRAAWDEKPRSLFKRTWTWPVRSQFCPFKKWQIHPAAA